LNDVTICVKCEIISIDTGAAGKAELDSWGWNPSSGEGTCPNCIDRGKIAFECSDCESELHCRDLKNGFVESASECGDFKFSKSLVNRDPPPKDGSRLIFTLYYENDDPYIMSSGFFQQIARYSTSFNDWLSDFDTPLGFDSDDIIHWQPAPDLEKIIAANERTQNEDD
jgi:hypothetical protein